MSSRAISPSQASLESTLSQGDGKATLILKDGTQLTGFSFGADTSMAGEVVFNTGMVGYPEALTDPSYRGQILCLTYPLIGNYGVPGDDKDEFGLPKFLESNEVHIRGLIISDYSHEHSHWNAKRSLGEWLKQNNVPGIYGIDTRLLTIKLRETGTMLGKIEMPGKAIPFSDPNELNLVAEVSTKIRTVYGAGNTPRILAYDCGMKHNIIRYFINVLKVELVVVPFDYDLDKENGAFDGLFISNGPGNPEMAAATIEQLKKVLAYESPKPIFGICLGNQLLALAAGASTYKMKYGNRGMNQPCVDLRTTKCYITPQNHGYAVDDETLPEGWKTFFLNANDMTNEGIIHETLPYFSVQFHPEAAGGPTDTAFLFDMFLQSVGELRMPLTTVPRVTYNVTKVRKCILVGSGGLSIGQAGEFDYSGSQAIKALKEESIEVILINPNIATVQTSRGFADKVYFLPVTADQVLEVIKKEKPDSILVSMGGQTALNVGVELFNRGELAKHNVRVLGTPIPVIVATEDREIFASKLAEINESLARTLPAYTVDEALEAAETIGYPCLVRAAFALGGLGSGFAANKEELRELAKKAFSSSNQILIDEDLRGWKEVEYEVVRDANDNCITVCNMENFDPLGVHTGDSIVIAPSQTLSNSEYFKLRQTALKVVRHLGVVGECNIQYALHPTSERYCIIEVNARLSRSSALASKATGYPLAYVAAKLALGMDLVTIRNSVTRKTTACFEPSLDYVVAKIPRWDLKKFSRVSNSLGSSMKSVGEVMAIGRNFEEVIQKAVRMVDPALDGFDSAYLDTSRDYDGDHELDQLLKHPTFLRLFCVARALEKGYSVDQIHALTKIDNWYLHKLKNITDMSAALSSLGSLSKVTKPIMKSLKCAGFSDKSIAKCLNVDEMAVRRTRVHNFGVTPFVKQIDTLAGEFPAQTNYLYMTYNASGHDIQFDEHGIMVLGCGPYCIGSSVEFDWCAVNCVKTLRKTGFKTIVVNYNPETVSTDYDESDRLYFEELSFERTLDIYEAEKSAGVIVSMGGQIPNCMALPLHRQGVNILGTPPSSIDTAEDRNKFSALLDSLNVDQPRWALLSSLDDAKEFADRVGYPVLVRPSYVLSGAAMRVASTEAELTGFLGTSVILNQDHPVVISKFIVNAKEIEFDAVAQHGKIINYAISEHVENAGVHSGDATLVLPAQRLYVETIRQVKRIAGSVAEALQITGPFNMQFMSKDNEVMVIECNLRSSRTFPFVSKTFKTNFIETATKAMCDLPVEAANVKLLDLDYVGIKAPMFSFTRLQGADPTLGVEMASTGEVACFGQDMSEAFLLAIQASGFKIPDKKKTAILSVGPEKAKEELVDSVRRLEQLGFKLYGTGGTADYYKERGINIEVAYKPSKKASPDAVTLIKDGEIDLVINVPDSVNTVSVTDGYSIRRTAVDFGISLLTNTKNTVTLVRALCKVKKTSTLSMDDIYNLGRSSMFKPKTLRVRSESTNRPSYVAPPSP